jgi:iron complex outermembrane receptor protein
MHFYKKPDFHGFASVGAANVNCRNSCPAPSRILNLLSALPLLMSVFSAAAWAEGEGYELGVIVVEAPAVESLPLGATLVDRPVIDTLVPATSDAATLLRNIPGVSLYGAGGVSSLPAIHGLADDRVRTQVDGVDLISSCPNHMNSALSYIDPTHVKSVEVYAGITPVSVGGDSLGGSIQVQSPDPEFAAPGAGLLSKGELGVFYRSNGNAKGANADFTLARENLSLNYAGSTAQSDNYKAGGDFKS